MAYTTQDIRNIALVGSAGAGKTLLLESLLLQAGAIRSKGSLQRGGTVSDFDPQEKRLQHSLDPVICGFDLNAVNTSHSANAHGNGTNNGNTLHVNVIDTPGYPDFLGRTLSVLEAVEAMAIVVSAVNGIDTVTQRLMEFTRERGLCPLVVINKIDSADALPAAVLDELRATFGPECLPLNLPANQGEAVMDSFFGTSTESLTPRLLLRLRRPHANRRPGRRARRRPHGLVSRTRRRAVPGATPQPF